MKRGGKGLTKRKKSLGRAVAAAMLLLLALVCAVADSKYHLQVTEYELRFDTLPAELDGLRVVHLSDLHGAEFGRDNARLIALIRAQAPDIIALTGDFAENAEHLEAVESLLKGISGSGRVYYVSGNHEWAGGVIAPIKALMEQYGVTCLENEYELFEKNGAAMVVAGVEDPNGFADMVKPDALAAALRQERPGDFVLWLGHRNYWLERYPKLPVDLILSGHAHGGIVRLPLIGGLLNVNYHLIADYETGLYESGSYRMEVSRGLGNSVPVPRLFNRPEIVVLTLRSGQT